MMLSLIIGIVVLIGALSFLRWYGNAKTEEVKKTLRWTGIGFGLLIVAFLALTGRLGVALAFDLHESLFHRLDSLADHAAVEFDLRFARTATVADAATLTLQVAPSTHQTG